MIASGEKFGFVFIERWLSNIKNIAFLRLDSKELDFIKRYFLKRSLGDFSWRIISKHPLFL
ncbi:hypothetical protein [Helicobacter pylori]|uniref:hypothetical protein n=1 Tax=Helicobacter pylori TaxID=210 RepID=UPI0013CDFB5F|nr:hypothetical protein [Helicobacter pylori]